MPECLTPSACQYNPKRKRPGRVCRSCARSHALANPAVREAAGVKMARGRIAKAIARPQFERLIVKAMGAAVARDILASHYAARPQERSNTQ